MIFYLIGRATFTFGGFSQGRRLTSKVSVCAKHVSEGDLGTALLEFCYCSVTAESYDVAESHLFPPSRRLSVVFRVL